MLRPESFYFFINKDIRNSIFKKFCHKFDGYELQWQMGNSAS